MEKRKPSTPTAASDRARKNLIRLMKERGWTQAELARRCEVDPPQVNQWLHARRGFGIKAEERLSKAFGVPWQEFLKMPDEPEMNEIIDLIFENRNDPNHLKTILKVLHLMQGKETRKHLLTAINIILATKDQP